MPSSLDDMWPPISLHQVRAGAAAVAAGVALIVSQSPPSPVASPQWVWPLAGGRPEVIRPFDPPAAPWHAGHRGADLAGAAGAEVLAAGTGIVTYAGLLAGVGVVAITHGELRTTYQPVSADVSVGDRVGAGEPIGALAEVGSHCAPAACLHWGLLRGEAYLDPMTLVGSPGRPRLLPLGPRTLVHTGDVPDRALAAAGTARSALFGALAGLTRVDHGRTPL